MKHSATDSQAQSPELPPAQVRALAALATGSSVTDAAKLAKVDRTTVHRWLREDTAFQAAWNSVRRDVWAEVETNLDGLLADALRAVREAIRDGDARIAIAVLKGAGVLAGKREIGPEHPCELADEQDLARKERSALRATRRMMIFP